MIDKLYQNFADLFNANGSKKSICDVHCCDTCIRWNRLRNTKA